MNLQAIEQDGRTTFAELTSGLTEGDKKEWFQKLMWLRMSTAARPHISIKTVDEVGLDSTKTLRFAFRPSATQIRQLL